MSSRSAVEAIQIIKKERIREEMKSKQAQNISDAIDWTTTRWRIESISNQVPHQQKPLEWSIHSVMQIKGTTKLVSGTM